MNHMDQAKRIADLGELVKERNRLGTAIGQKRADNANDPTLRGDLEERAELEKQIKQAASDIGHVWAVWEISLRGGGNFDALSVVDDEYFMNEPAAKEFQSKLAPNRFPAGTRAIETVFDSAGKPCET